MRINFFEEYPTKANLAKAHLIKHPCIVFLAAKSMNDFLSSSAELKKFNQRIESAYWPIIANSYWISPFSNTKDLQNLYNELETNQIKGLKVLLDLELPFKNLKLILKNLFSFRKNKKIIKSIFKNADKFGIEIFTAEYPLPHELLHFLGISYPRKYKHSRIPMYYSSMLTWERIKKYCRDLVTIPQKRHTHIALGVIKKGTFGNEPILSAENLKKDLEFFKDEAASVTIFRLGGLNKKYIDIIKGYQKKY